MNLPVHIEKFNGNLKKDKKRRMITAAETTEDLCKLCDGNIECAPTALLLISLIHALYGHLGPEPDYFKGFSSKTFNLGTTEQVTKSKHSKDSLEKLDRFRRRKARKKTNQKMTDGKKYSRLQSVTMPEDSEATYDFIIVGGGTAGCVLASRLSENRQWKVLLVEAGPEEPKLSLIPGLTSEFIGSSVDWKYAMRPNKRFCQNRRELGCEVVQGRALGGTSSINNMAYVRGSPADYDEWVLMGNEGWSYSQVLPYFKHSEGNYDPDIFKNKFFHNKQGPLDVGKYPYADENVELIIAAMKEIGFNSTDVNGQSQLGVMRVQSTSYYGERVSTYSAFIEPIRNLRPNIDITTNALVTKILTDVKGEHLRATGIEYLVNGTIYKIKTKKEVILSAGAINSPKILMQSGIGPRDYLEYLELPVNQDLPVGNNLQDHLSVCLPIIKLTKTATTANFQEKMKDITSYYEKGHGPLSANFQVIAFLETKFSEILGVPDLEIRFKGHNSNMYYDRMEMCVSLLTPQSKGEILLNDTDYVFGKPLIYPNFLTKQSDRKKLLYGLQEMIKIFDTETFVNAGIGFDPYPLLNNDCKLEEQVSERFWMCIIKHFTTPSHNYVGTCKMGPISDPDSVVDSELKMYGVSHLRVVDASIIPKITRGSTAAPVVMIAEKASDLIKEQWY